MKKMSKMLISGLVLSIILSANFFVSAKCFDVEAQENSSMDLGTLRVNVYVNGKNFSRATVAAYELQIGHALYNIPLDQLTQSYVRDLPVGTYNITARVGTVLESKNVQIQKDDVTHICLDLELYPTVSNN